MRKIKFRGKEIESSKWVYGMPYSFKPFLDTKTDEQYILMFNPEWELEAQFNYLKDPTGFSHLEDSVWKVVPASVGQYTGREDKNNQEIYEGDILYFYYPKYPDSEGNYVVRWNEEDLCFEAVRDTPYNYMLPPIWHEGEIITE